jgi:hypothetical protein
LSELEADVAPRLNRGPQPAQLEGHRVKRLRRVSVLHRRNVVASHKKASSARPQDPDRPVVPRILKSKAAAERPRSSAVEHRRLQPAQVLESVAAAQSEDSLATASLARRLRVLVQVNSEAEKNADNPQSTDLRRHRLPVQVQAKREVQEREGWVPLVNLAANQEPARLLQPSTGKGSRSAERKRARGPHRHEDHNNRVLLACGRLAAFEAFGNTATQPRGYSSSAICTAFSAAPLSN